MPRITVMGVPLGGYETNGYLVFDPDDQSNACWLVDTGEHPEPLFALARREGKTPALILFTHAHVDHIAGAGEATAAYPGVPRLGHPIEHGWFGDPDKNLSGWSGFPITVPAPTGTLAQGDELPLGASRWRVIETPGHSPGSISLCTTNLDQPIAIVGDTIFQGSVGRVDLPGANPSHFATTLFDRLLALPDDTRIFPGHGPPTTIGAERRANPFLRGGRENFVRAIA